MRQDDIQLAIRPRTILECLDMAFLFCGRHPVGLTLASAMGIIPMAVLNWHLLRDPEFNGYLGYLLLSMEMPWATLLLTLYLGQITFSRKFSTRKAGRDFIRALPAMFLFQFLFRGLCLVMVILVPVVFLGTYYLNEIILLEQTPLSKTWSRRGAVNARGLSTIISLRVLDLIILVAGTSMLSMLIRSVSELWEDRFQWKVDLIWTDMTEIDWQLQVSFWMVIVFLTVFRFISYLDCRIRREGWDVELKLRDLADVYRQRELAQ